MSIHRREREGRGRVREGDGPCLPNPLYRRKEKNERDKYIGVDCLIDRLIARQRRVENKIKETIEFSQ